MFKRGQPVLRAPRASLARSTAGCAAVAASEPASASQEAIEVNMAARDAVSRCAGASLSYDR
jgi:hypothetical protein